MGCEFDVRALVVGAGSSKFVDELGPVWVWCGQCLVMHVVMMTLVVCPEVDVGSWISSNHCFILGSRLTVGTAAFARVRVCRCFVFVTVYELHYRADCSL